MRPALAILTLLLPIVATTAGAEIYRYTDASGTEHFTMDLQAVPEQYRAQAARQAEEGAKRIQIMPSHSRLDSRLGPEPEPEGSRAWPPAQPAAPSLLDLEHSWRNRFAAKRKAVADAERRLEDAEAANRTIRSGYSSSPGRAQQRWARQKYRKEKAEKRLEAAEAKLEAAEDAMHRLRLRAADAQIPDDWMR